MRFDEFELDSPRMPRRSIRFYIVVSGYALNKGRLLASTSKRTDKNVRRGIIPAVQIELIPELYHALAFEKF